MPTQNVSAISSSVRVGRSPKRHNSVDWQFTTAPASMHNQRTMFHVLASGDNQAIHLDDNVAKDAGFDRRIVHGHLLLGVAKELIRRSEIRNLDARNYGILDMGGCQGRPKTPVFPEESIFVRYNRRGRLRAGRSPISIEFAVFVNREGREMFVIDGEINSLLIPIKRPQV